MTKDANAVATEQQRVQRHTEQVIRELDEAIAIWVHNGLDWRAIFMALATYHTFYSRQIGEKTGGVTLMKLQDEADKLADAMLKRHGN